MQTKRERDLTFPRQCVDKAELADSITEDCLKEMSRGSMGIFKNKMYPLVFKIVFEKLINQN